MDNRRIIAIDIFRGLAVFIMLLVDSLPDFVNAYPLLLHSEWQGLTLADTAFPSFMFIMGTAMVISFSKHKDDSGLWRKAVRRGIILIALGMVYNNIPAIAALIIQDGFTLNEFYDFVIVHGRPCGVLQRLGIAYIIVTGIWLPLKEKNNDVRILVTIAFSMLLFSSIGYHLYNAQEPFSQLDNISIFIDSAMLGAVHTYGGQPFDPEGMYGTINSVATVLFGCVAGQILLSDEDTAIRMKRLNKMGTILLAVGAIWSIADIVSKPLWTSPYVLIMAGLDMLVLMIFMEDRILFRFYSIVCRPFIVLGSNPILLYMLNGAMLSVLWTVTTEGTPIYYWLWQHSLFDVENIEYSCAVFAVCYCAVLWLAAEWLYIKRIFIKV